MTGYIIADIIVVTIILAFILRAACMGNRRHEIVEEGPLNTLAPSDDPADWKGNRIVKELEK